MTRMLFEIDLPEDVVTLLGASDEAVSARVRQAMVLDLLREGQISQGWAARVLGISRYDILDLMAKYEISSGPATIEEYRQDVENAERFLARRQARPAGTDPA